MFTLQILSKSKAKQLSMPWITTGLKGPIMVKNKLFVSGDEEKYKFIRETKFITSATKQT